MNKGLVTTGAVLSCGIVAAGVWTITANGNGPEEAPPQTAAPTTQPMTFTPATNTPRIATELPEGISYLSLAGDSNQPRNAQDFRARFEELRAQWDLDGDGELSREEREMMFEAMRAERLAERLARFDANGDGVLDDEE